MKIISKNRMSAEALKQLENDNIRFIENPKTGKLFFTCGSKQGYISPAIQEANASGDLALEDMQYAECSTDNGVSFVPCLMMVGDGSKNIRATF